MKIKNKETGETGNFVGLARVRVNRDGEPRELLSLCTEMEPGKNLYFTYDSLADFIKDWEDAKDGD
jgi:hypothetical protein